MKIAMIGAGLSGLACATRLAQAKHVVTVYDKGRRPGGRMAVRSVGTARGAVSFDHGAPYFTARDPGFLFEVERWAREGTVASWPSAGVDAWVGTLGMNAPALALAAALDVQSSVRIEALRRDRSSWEVVSGGGATGPFDAVVLALPAEQARALIAPWDTAMEAAAQVQSEPCWTAMASFEDRVSILEDVIRHRGVIDFAGRNSAKPGRSGPECWVIHATTEWSRSHLEEPAETIAPQLLSALASNAASGLPDASFLAAHRWRYARSGRFGSPSLWNGELKVGLCGDWLLGPRIECAWLSGIDLAAQIGAA